MRTLRTLGILTAAVLLSTLVASAPAVAQQRTLTVTPFADVEGGQIVQLTGSGWTPNTTVGMCQAATQQPGEPATQQLCGRPTATVTSDGAGDFVAQLSLDRFLYIPFRNAWIDCTDPADTGCGIGAGELDDIAGTVTTPDPQIEFAPDPPDPAQRGAISYAPAIGVNPGGTVTVTGTGFTADAVVDVYQCLPGATHPETCDPALQSLQRVVADGSGGFVVEFVVEGIIDPPGDAPAVDCQTAACVISAAEAVDFPGTVVETDLNFPAKVVPEVAQVTEGDAGAITLEIPVSLSKAADDEVTVEWETWFIDQGAPNEADPASDYQAVSDTLVFPVGVTDAVVQIPVNGDIVFEPDEVFVVRFFNPTNAVIGGFYGLGFGVIENDEPATEIVPGTFEVTEGDTNSQVVQVPLTLTSASTTDISVDWTTANFDGTPLAATEGVDYVAAFGTAFFPAGQTTPTTPVSVTINGDTDIETDELVVVQFENPVGAPLGGFYGLGFVAILDDDTP
ncbi:MAG: hypothetical protein HKN26_02995 [Acidimicrobiales bacterium]|nr:hypothetical protein [Acidimicrobiales bacterium]